MDVICKTVAMNEETLPFFLNKKKGFLLKGKNKILTKEINKNQKRGAGVTWKRNRYVQHLLHKSSKLDLTWLIRQDYIKHSMHVIEIIRRNNKKTVGELGDKVEQLFMVLITCSSYGWERVIRWGQVTINDQTSSFFNLFFV